MSTYPTFMIGPSGFFQEIGDANVLSPSADLEIIHDSEHGFNVLYKVNKNGRFFVYKALKPEYRGNAFYEELLKKDFNIGFSLNHPNICQYYGMVNVPSLGNCIVMDWVDGCNLERLLSKGKIGKKLAEKLICELCDALDYMHRKQIIHRDLKPENILVTYNGNNVKIIDFGLSDADSYYLFKAPAGTRVYASPELVAGESIDSRSDLWALGMIINEMTDYYRHVASGCLYRNRDKRYATAADLKNAVMRTGRRKTVLSAVCILAAVLAVAGILWLVGNVRLPMGAQDTVLPAENDEPARSLQDTSVIMVPEPAVIPVAEPRSISPETENEEHIDAESLDDLFKEAAESILH